MEFNQNASPFDEQPTTDSQFHHFQLVGNDGSVPMSISILVRMHDKPLDQPGPREPRYATTPISTNDVLELHEALEQFGGNFRAAFQSR